MINKKQKIYLIEIKSKWGGERFLFRSTAFTIKRAKENWMKHHPSRYANEEDVKVVKATKEDIKLYNGNKKWSTTI